MKVAIVTGVWKRPEVFELFAKGAKQLLKIKGIEWKVIVVGSENHKSMHMVRRQRFDYIEAPNNPLARKMNTTIRAARDWGADYVLCLGSDDIITPQMMLIYIEQMNKGIDFIGVLDFFFYDLPTKRALYWGGYEDGRKGHTCGAGRVLSSNLLGKWGWKIWEDKQSKVLDNSMEDKLNKTPHTSHTFKCVDFDVMRLDIKSSTNMTPFECWANTVEIDGAIIREQINYIK